MASHHLLPCTRSFVTSIYDVGSYILLLYLVIDIAVSVQSLIGVSAGLSISNKFVTLAEVVEAFIVVILRGLPLDCGSPTGVFLFGRIDVSKSHSINNFAPCSDLSIYGSLAIITCFVYGAQTQKCFAILGLYPMSISFQIF